MFFCFDKSILDYFVSQQDILIAANRKGYPAGIAYIKFKDASTAMDAQKALDGLVIGRRRLTVGILEIPREADNALSLYH